MWLFGINNNEKDFFFILFNNKENFKNEKDN